MNSNFFTHIYRYLVISISALIFGFICFIFFDVIKKSLFPSFVQQKINIDDTKNNNENYISHINTENKEKIIGLWVSYIDLNISNSENTKDNFEKKFDEIIEKSKKYNINNLYVHVRPFCDSFYPSKIFPWSEYLTGIQGQTPNFDPLKYMIEVSHKNNIKFHAWINPLRVKTSTSPKKISIENVLNKLTDSKYFIKSDELTCLNPGYKETRDIIIDGIKEICSNYNIDGIHFDDYFYPENTSLKDAAFDEFGDNDDIIKWRKKSILSLVKETSDAIKSINSKIQFGISPPGNIEKCNIVGFDIENIYKSGFIDYICPQIYWSLECPYMPFEKTAKKWKNMLNNTNNKCNIYCGIALYKIETDADNKTWKKDKSILAKELKILQNLEYNGAIFYSYSSLDTKKEEISNLYKEIKNLN